MKAVLWLMLVVWSVYGAGEGKKRIFILHSYTQEYGWTKSQHKAFVDDLERSLSVPLEISTEYLDTKRIGFSDSYQDFFFHYLQTKYYDYHPDVIYVTDDNALEFLIRYHAQLFPTTPIFFSGINNLSLIHSLDPHWFTGVYETKDIDENIALIRQFSPQTRDIWFVGDASTTYKSIEADIRQKIMHYPNYRFHFLASPKIHSVMKQLPHTPKTFVILTTIGGWEDNRGKNLMLSESIGLLRGNNHLILCSMEDAYLVGGVVGGFVTSGIKQGSSAAQLLIRYLHGHPLATLSSLTKSPNVYMFDRQAMTQSRIILSTYIARHAIIINEKKNFFEKNQKIIMDILFIFFVFILVLMMGLYFVTRQKKRYIVELEEMVEEKSFELERLKQKLLFKGEIYD